MELLKDKVVIVSGAADGIGRALAIQIARQGGSVVVNDLDVDRRIDGSTTSELIAGEGGKAIGVSGNAAVSVDVERLLDQALETFGRVDGIVNNAGIVRDKMIFSMTDEDWDAVMQVHLRGHFLLTSAACRLWRNTSKETGAPAAGRIVCISSEAGIHGNVGQANYSAAKGGIVSFSRVVAREMARYGVTCNAVAPRARTSMTEGAFGSIGSSGISHPWDIDNVPPLIEFLLSDEGGNYTGQTFVAGGGTLQVLAPPTSSGVDDVGDEPISLDRVRTFIRENLGESAEVSPFPDLGL